MKVLIMGSPTTDGFKAFDLNCNVFGGGWVENLVKGLAEKDIELFVCFYTEKIKELSYKKYNGVTYCALPVWVRGLKSCNGKMKRDIDEMLSFIKPDIVHIIGTEREHDYYLFKKAGREKTLISTTGLVSYCAVYYFGGIEKKNFIFPSIGDIIRHGGPIIEKKNFERYAVTEKKLFLEAKYVSGRTDWDRSCVEQINPDIIYYHCGEILNEKYLQGKWEVEKVKRHSIFIGQGNYPLKGVHVMIEALSAILKSYPDTEVVIAGANIFKKDTFKDRIKQTTYSKYLQRLIKKHKIPQGKIRYIGPQSVDEMKKNYLSCNAYVMPSSIENSPNSLGEAMSLGVPCVASAVGGIPSMIEDGETGLLFPFSEPYTLADKVCKIFASDEFAKELGERAQRSALKRFNAKDVVETTISIYNEIEQNKN